MADDVVLVEVVDGVAVVTLNRPEARNAINGPLGAALQRAVGDLGADDGVAAIVLTGAHPAFCAGMDLKELGGGGPVAAGNTGAAAGARRMHRYFPAVPKPVVGAVNGPVATGGLELALQCSFLVASERARFADTHARVGIIPGGGVTVGLAQAVGVRRAREMSLTGNWVDAPTALAWGLVNHVVPHDELLPLARRLAADTAAAGEASRRLLAIYDDVASSMWAEAERAEMEASGEWAARSLDRADLDARRQALVDRARTQG